MSLKKKLHNLKTQIIGIIMPREKQSVLDEIRKAIPRIREPGERPQPNFLTSDSYICDLCRGSMKEPELVQCGFCGRWVCKNNCWNTGYYACISCSGIIKLTKEIRGDKSHST